MTNRDIQYIIDNVPFDYSIKIEESNIRCFTSPTLKSEFPEPSSGSDQQISCEKENKDSEFLETEDNNISEKAKSLPEEEIDEPNDSLDSNSELSDDDGFCGFSDDDDEGYYYDLSTGETYRKSDRSICIY
ncbi:8942_t:CDS:2 [Ambispora leptoticha]|uniref:8942_t:CDS:1 n=1 Tax=Ambispora leptoticha TaxID=144679 RepID=A0A9N8VBM1_9GLOM|nr:8942_t:CDS:2 [Ambispora leptoticha]